MISVIIPCRNEKYLLHTLNGLFNGQFTERIEVIVIDDASDIPVDINHSEFSNVRVIRNSVQLGVGQCFDIGVRNCKYENIVLMGSDVVVKNSPWIDIAEYYSKKYPKGIACSVCLSGDPDHLDPNNPADDTERYGATILPLCTTEDLASDSPLLEQDTYHVDMFESKWLKTQPDSIISEIPCVYGAFYITTKSWYNTIHGWDDSHKTWGGLESWISIKSWLYGGQCHVITNLATLHIFHKLPKNDDSFVASGQFEKYWYNKMFIAYTMLPVADSYALLNKVYEMRVDYELYTHQFNLGKKMIVNNWAKILEIREHNRREFVRDFDWFCSYFGINKNF